MNHGPPPLLQLGFRPFFLLAGAAALALLGAWLAWLYLPATLPDSRWHGHEMLTGYTGAVMAGFLLTAARNWTGRDTARGAALAALVLLWLAGRWGAAAAAGPWTAAADGAFFLGLAVFTGRPVLAARQRHNLVFPALLLLMGAADAGYHAGGGPAALQALLWLILTLLSVLAGRVLPFFTARALPGAPERRRPLLEAAGSGLLAALALAAALGAPAVVQAALAALALIPNAWRAASWFDRRIREVPLLWVLHLAFGWLLVGLLLAALRPLWPALADAATHALTTGAIGGMTLGMMARVSLGHTGRPLVPPPGIPWAFALVHLGALARVLAGTGLWPQGGLVLAGACWLAAFGLFLWRYAPMLVAPRADGRPG